jgi:hypothetical protein
MGTIPVPVRLTAEDLARLDADRAARGMSRSAYVQHVLRMYWDRDAVVLAKLDAILAALPDRAISPPPASPDVPGPDPLRASAQALLDGWD